MRPVNATKHATRVSSTLALTIFSFCSLSQLGTGNGNETKNKTE